MKLYKSVTLVGIMGSGKTCIAKKLAKKLDTYHVDTDEEIKIQSGFSVKELIESNQENTLKEIEFDIIKSNVNNRCIISTGDYTVNNQKGWDYLMYHSLTIWINIHLNKIITRLRPTENRPFYSDETNLKNLKDIYNERKKRYKQSKIHMKSLNTSKINELIKIINNFTSETVII